MIRYSEISDGQSVNCHVENIGKSGSSITSMSWIQSYLFKRQQYITLSNDTWQSVNSYKSDCPIDLCVTQGSAIGLVLFLTYLNDQLNKKITQLFFSRKSFLYRNFKYKKIYLVNMYSYVICIFHLWQQSLLLILIID